MMTWAPSSRCSLSDATAGANSWSDTALSPTGVLSRRRQRDCTIAWLTGGSASTEMGRVHSGQRSGRLHTYPKTRIAGKPTKTSWSVYRNGPNCSKQTLRKFHQCYLGTFFCFNGMLEQSALLKELVAASHQQLQHELGDAPGEVAQEAELPGVALSTEDSGYPSRR